MSSEFYDEDGTLRLRGTATGVAPSGAAGGALGGTFPNPDLAAGVAGSGLGLAGNALAVNVDGSTLEVAADALRVKDLGITAAKLAAAVAGDGLTNSGVALAVVVDGATLEIVGDTVRIKDLGVTTGKIALLAVTDAQVATANKDGAAATPSLRTLGTGAAQAAAGNDSRLTDARAPTGNAGGKLKNTYPNPDVDEDILGGVYWTVVRKTADESVASSTVPQNDDELFFTAVAGAYYEVELLLVYASPAGGATPDMKCDLGEDATARGAFQTTQFTPTDAASQTNILSDQSATFTPGTAAAKRMVFVEGHHVGAGGTFRLRWAQNTSGVNPTILYATSILRYRRIN